MRAISSVSASVRPAPASGPRLEALHELGGGRNADVGGDQGLLEPLPRCLVARVEGRCADLFGQRPAAAAERVAEPREHPAPAVLRLRTRVFLAEQLSPRPCHPRGG